MPGSKPKYVMTPDDIARQQRLSQMTPEQQKNAMIKFGEMLERETKVYYDKEAEKRGEQREAKFKKGDIIRYNYPDNEYLEINVSQGEHIKGINIVYHKAVSGKGWSATEVATGRSMFAAGTRKEVIAHTQKYFADPKNVTSALQTVKEVRASNLKAGIKPSPETIELFKSRTTGEFTTKAGVRKEGVKALAGKVKPAGTTMINALGAITLMSPLIGAYGALKKTNIEEAEAKSAYPLYNVKPRGITAEDYGQSLWHRLAPQVFRSVKEQRKWDKKFPIPGDA